MRTKKIKTILFLICAALMTGCGASEQPAPVPGDSSVESAAAAEEAAIEESAAEESAAAAEEAAIEESAAEESAATADEAVIGESAAEEISVPLYGPGELLAAEEAAAESGDEEKFLEMLSVSLPYKGMSDKYIDKTWLGAPNYGPVYDSLRDYSYTWCVGDKEPVFWVDVKNDDGSAVVTLAHSKGLKMWDGENSGPLFTPEDIRSAKVPETPSKEESIEHYDEIMKYDSAEEYADHMHEALAEEYLFYNDEEYGDGFEEDAFGDAWNDCYNEWMRNRG